MPAYKIKDRLIPYKILTYLLFGPTKDLTWLEHIKDNKVRLMTGETARALRVKNSELWEALYWLKEQKLVEKVTKDQKRGTVVISLYEPKNIRLTES